MDEESLVPDRDSLLTETRSLLNRLHEENLTLRDAMDKAQKDRERSEKEIERISAARDEMEVSLKKLNYSLQVQVQTKTVQLQESVAHAESLHAQLTLALSERDDTRQRLESITPGYETLRQDSARLTMKVDQYQQQREILQQENDAMRLELDARQVQISHATKLHEEQTEDLQAEAKKQRVLLQRATARKEELKGELTAIHEIMIELSRQSEDQLCELQQRNRHIYDSTQQQAAQVEYLSQCISDLSCFVMQWRDEEDAAAERMLSHVVRHEMEMRALKEKAEAAEGQGQSHKETSESLRAELTILQTQEEAAQKKIGELTQQLRELRIVYDATTARLESEGTKASHLLAECQRLQLDIARLRAESACHEDDIVSEREACKRSFAEREHALLERCKRLEEEAAAARKSAQQSQRKVSALEDVNSVLNSQREQLLVEVKRAGSVLKASSVSPPPVLDR